MSHFDHRHGCLGKIQPTISFEFELSFLEIIHALHHYDLSTMSRPYLVTLAACLFYAVTFSRAGIRYRTYRTHDLWPKDRCKIFCHNSFVKL